MENFVEVAIGLDDVCFATLKVRLCQLGFDEQIAPTHIDFSAIGATAFEGDSGLPAEFRLGLGVDAHHAADRRRCYDFGSAEDVHEQGVGTHAGIEFAPFAGGIDLRPGERAALCVNLVKPANPIGARCDGSVCGGVEVTVMAILRRVNDDRVGAIALDVGMASGVTVVAEGEFGAKLARAEEGGIGGW